MVSLSSFSRQARLLHSREFHRVFNHTDCKSADACVIVLAAQNDCDSARLGLAISKKKIKTAVARNRLKRIIRESFRQHRSELNTLDIVVLAQSRAATMSNRDVFNSLDSHWKNINNRCKKSPSQ